MDYTGTIELVLVSTVGKVKPFDFATHALICFKLVAIHDSNDM